MLGAEKAQQFIKGKNVKKVIVVPKALVNVVVASLPENPATFFREALRLKV